MPTARQFPCIALSLTILVTLSLLALTAATVRAGDDGPLQAQLRDRVAHQNHTQIQLQLQTQSRARLGDTAGGPSNGTAALADRDHTRDRDQDGDQTRLRDRLRIGDGDAWTTWLLRLGTLLGVTP